VASLSTDLRSRCQLFPTAQGSWELLDEPGAELRTFGLPSDNTTQPLNEAVTAARAEGLPYRRLGRYITHHRLRKPTARQLCAGERHA